MHYRGMQLKFTGYEITMKSALALRSMQYSVCIALGERDTRRM